MIRVAIVEDNRDFSEALLFTLESEADLRPAGCWSTAEAFLEAIENEEARPDVVIMDINLPGISGVECVFRMKQRAAAIEAVMCTVHDDGENVFNALKAGACGYILKSDGADRIVHAVRSAAQGGAPFTPRIARMMLGFFSQPRPSPPGADALTARENEVLQLLGQGKSYRQISDQLFVSLGTTQSHVKSIYSKLHVHSRVEIMRLLKIG